MLYIVELLLFTKDLEENLNEKKPKMFYEFIYKSSVNKETLIIIMTIAMSKLIMIQQSIWDNDGHKMKQLFC